MSKKDKRIPLSSERIYDNMKSALDMIVNDLDMNHPTTLAESICQVRIMRDIMSIARQIEQAKRCHVEPIEDDDDFPF